MSKTMADLFGGQAVYDRVWDLADDASHTVREMQEIYDDVPEDLKKVPVDVLSVHIYPEHVKEKAFAWLNKKHQQESV